MNLSFRSHEHELMDGVDFSNLEYEKTLKQLEVINRLTQGYRPTISAIAKVARENPGRTLRILDIGFGHGDTLRAVRKWSRENNVDLELYGIDLNPLATKTARSMTPVEDEIFFRTGNVFELDDEMQFDMMINALVMHHLTDREIVQLLRFMTERSRIAWFINDLHRHPIAYHFIRSATHLARCTRMIQNDAPLSVARSFKAKDWWSYIAEAGIPFDVVDLHWHWAFRYGVYCNASLARERMRGLQ